MSTKPSNTFELLPKNRYEDDSQTYVFDGPNGTEIRLDREDGARLVSIPSLGISAGGVVLDHVPVNFNGELFVKALAVTHRPSLGPNGVLEIDTVYEDR